MLIASARHASEGSTCRIEEILSRLPCKTCTKCQLLIKVILIVRHHGKKLVSCQ
jgi:hypothetical protein